MSWWLYLSTLWSEPDRELSLPVIWLAPVYCLGRYSLRLFLGLSTHYFEKPISYGKKNCHLAAGQGITHAGSNLSNSGRCQNRWDPGLFTTCRLSRLQSWSRVYRVWDLYDHKICMIGRSTRLSSGWCRYKAIDIATKAGWLFLWLIEYGCISGFSDNVTVPTSALSLAYAFVSGDNTHCLCIFVSFVLCVTS